VLLPVLVRQRHARAHQRHGCEQTDQFLHHEALPLSG
jgi:hypothetical protein